MLIIQKIFNNNAVLALKDNQTEIVALGKGIAFGKKAGDELEETLVEKTFSLEKDPFSQRLTEILSEIPAEYFRLTNLIVNYANQALGAQLSNSVYVSLTDHLFHAVARIKNGQPISNHLLFEIKRLYKTEFLVGKYAVQLVERELGVALGGDEAGFVALHIFSSRTDSQSVADTVRTTQIVRDILRLVSLHFGLQLDEKSHNYARFVTHLQYFASRLFHNQQVASSEDDFLYQQTCKAYPAAYQCVEKIDRYLIQNYQKALTQDEALYLTIHIQRVVK